MHNMTYFFDLFPEVQWHHNAYSGKLNGNFQLLWRLHDYEHHLLFQILRQFEYRQLIVSEMVPRYDDPQCMMVWSRTVKPRIHVLPFFLACLPLCMLSITRMMVTASELSEILTKLHDRLSTLENASRNRRVQ